MTAPAAGQTRVDHLVLAAATLQQGVDWCEATLGLTPGPGGQHALMGTHNRLFKIAGAAFPEAYFEIIAIDPEAPPPGRARWFGLDDAALQARLRQGPRLVHVVARCTALAARRQALIDAGMAPGVVLNAGRDTPQGRLQWQIEVRDDGCLGCGGALPTLIEWQGVHASAAMPASGVELRSLALRGVPSAAQAALQLRGVEHLPLPGAALRATLATPRGEVTLES
ncbi:MAG: VOC family protein [Leptothrix sp. (in: Bacteria)]|nr:VOC family protein [Leptothrix sp. (in: b-proteobacteria)]